MVKPVTDNSEFHSLLFDGNTTEELNLLRSIWNSATAVSIVPQDLEGTIIAWNEGARRFYGYEVDEIIGKSVFILNDPIDVNSGKTKDIFNEVCDKGIWSGELKCLRKNGSSFIAYSISTLRYDANNNPIGYTTISLDVTSASEALHHQSDLSIFINDFLESSTSYSFIVQNLNGVIQIWNKGATRDYGYTENEVLGKNASILGSADEQQSKKLKEFYEAALKYGSCQGDFECVRKNGETFPANLNLVLRKDHHGTPLGYILISKDISQIKYLEKLHLKNKEYKENIRCKQEILKMKNEFLSNMSHEMRTPLNGIIGFSELMLKDKKKNLSKQHEEYISDIHACAKVLFNLINNILDLASIESEKIDFHPTQVDLGKLVGEVSAMLSNTIAQKKIKLDIQIDPSLTNIIIDPSRLKQVLYNYVSNAIKFTTSNAQVTIRVSPEDEKKFRLEVLDTGIGIHPKDFSKLFSDFQQLDASFSKKYPGTGLGLALTRRIVKAQGGEVGFKSTEGKGSCFFAILPKTPDHIDQKLDS